MTEEEAEEALRTLQAFLAETGATALGAQARSAALDEGAESSSHVELALLLDELESVLVDVPGAPNS